MIRKQTEVLVVGAGPVGLFSALSLAQRGVEVQVIDQEWRKAARSYALALHPHSLELLSEFGLTKELVEHGYRVDRVVLLEEGERRAQVDYSALASPWPFLLVLPQSALEGAMESALAARQIPVDWNHSLADLAAGPEGTRATIERREKISSGYAAAGTDWVIDRILGVDAAVTVGADGNRSSVRRQLSIPFEEMAEPEYYAVFEFDTDFDAKGEVLISTAPDGGADVLWPLPGGRCRMSFALTGEERVARERSKSRLTVQIAGEGYPHLDREDLLRRLAERSPWFAGEVGALHWSLVVRFEHRLARRFGAGRTWLAGDAAHLTGPVGIASMNEGFAEADDLSRRIHETLRGGLPLARLADYGDRHAEIWRRRFSAGGGFAAGPNADPYVRKYADRLPALLPACGEELARLAAELGLVPRDADPD